MRPVRALIVGGRDVVRAGLERVLQADESIHLVGTTPSGRRGIELLGPLAPDVVLLDQVLPDIGSGDFCARASAAGIWVLVLSADVDDATIGVMLRAGARGFVRLGIDAADLRDAVRAVARGDGVLDPLIAKRVVGWVHERPIGRGRSLSRREAEVLRLVACGHPDHAIASMLSVSRNTVKTYVRRGLGKLHCRSRSEAAAAVARHGLLDAVAGAPA